MITILNLTVGIILPSSGYGVRCRYHLHTSGRVVGTRGVGIFLSVAIVDMIALMTDTVRDLLSVSHQVCIGVVLIGPLESSRNKFSTVVSPDLRSSRLF